MRTAEDTTKSLSQGRLDRPHLSYTLPSLLAALLFLSLYLRVDSYLDVVSILGIRIRTTKRHWDAVVKKHESLADLKHAAENTLRAPRYVRLSKEDA